MGNGDKKIEMGVEQSEMGNKGIQSKRKAKRRGKSKTKRQMQDSSRNHHAPQLSK